MIKGKLPSRIYTIDIPEKLTYEPGINYVSIKLYLRFATLFERGMKVEETLSSFKKILGFSENSSISESFDFLVKRKYLIKHVPVEKAPNGKFTYCYELPVLNK